MYDDWPKIAEKSYLQNIDEYVPINIEHIIFVGMGGSGSICDLFFSILSDTSLHVNVVKGYHLPKTANSKSLVILVSVSGNSKETFNVLQSAHNLNCNIISFSSGGLIEQFCKSNKIEHRKLPETHSPRLSFISYVYSILKTIPSLFPISDDAIKKSITSLYDTSVMINSTNLTDTNPALNLAEWINKIPIIYYPWGLESAAVRFKNSLNENAKTHAIIEDIIEACHNDIVAWEKTSNVIPILLRGKDDYLKTKERWDILKEFFVSKNIEYKEIFSVNGTILSKLVNMIYLLDYASIYSASLREIDPSSISPINFIKNRI